MHIYTGGLLCGSIDGYVFTTVLRGVLLPVLAGHICEIIVQPGMRSRLVGPWSFRSACSLLDLSEMPPGVPLSLRTSSIGCAQWPQIVLARGESVLIPFHQISALLGSMHCVWLCYLTRYWSSLLVGCLGLHAWIPLVWPGQTRRRIPVLTAARLVCSSWAREVARTCVRVFESGQVFESGRVDALGLMPPLWARRISPRYLRVLDALGRKYP